MRPLLRFLLPLVVGLGCARPSTRVATTRQDAGAGAALRAMDASVPTAAPPEAPRRALTTQGDGDAGDGGPPIIRGAPAATRFFVLGATMRFLLDDDVDTHAPDTRGPVRTSGEVLATVRAVTAEGRSVVADVAWSLPPDLDWVTFPEHWVLREGSLWVLDGPMAAPDASDDALDRAPPLLTAADAARGTMACKETRDSSPYGPTRVRVCFDARGLVSWVEENRQGPRRLSLSRR